MTTKTAEYPVFTEEFIPDEAVAEIQALRAKRDRSRQRLEKLQRDYLELSGQFERMQTAYDTLTARYAGQQARLQDEYERDRERIRKTIQRFRRVEAKATYQATAFVLRTISHTRLINEISRRLKAAK